MNDAKQYGLSYRSNELLKQKGSLQENICHISSLGWEHINFLGEYTFDQKRNASLNALLPHIQGKIEAVNLSVKKSALCWLYLCKRIF
ncbi:hypothetical protein MHL86_23800 [Brevibacillus laterosporus]|nr:hypothetical protein [Brevibacillus laterosporus]